MRRVRQDGRRARATLTEARSAPGSSDRSQLETTRLLPFHLRPSRLGGGSLLQILGRAVDALSASRRHRPVLSALARRSATFTAVSWAIELTQATQRRHRPKPGCVGVRLGFSWGRFPATLGRAHAAVLDLEPAGQVGSGGGQVACTARRRCRRRQCKLLVRATHQQEPRCRSRLGDPDRAAHQAMSSLTSGTCRQHPPTGVVRSPGGGGSARVLSIGRPFGLRRRVPVPLPAAGSRRLLRALLAGCAAAPPRHPLTCAGLLPATPRGAWACHARAW